MQIPIDFVAGTHGHFLEIFLNRSFNFLSETFDPFNPLGTSHNVTEKYRKEKVFDAKHWFEHYKSELSQYQKSIVITFEPEDLLLVSSTSMLRAADLNIHNNYLETNTVCKLNNEFYKDTLSEIFKAYPFLDKDNPNIPRYVLREFYKFGFKNPNHNGYYKQMIKMLNAHCDLDSYYISLQEIYSYKTLTKKIKDLAIVLNLKPTIDDSCKQLHTQFIKKLQFTNHKQICDTIIYAVINGKNMQVPKLTLFQESYINGILEKHYGKEMPFIQDEYFTKTKDMLQYIKETAPTL